MAPTRPQIVKLSNVRPLSQLGKVPGLKALAQHLPAAITGQPAQLVKDVNGNVSPMVALALPRVEGNAEPFALQSDQTDLYDLFTNSIGESTEFYFTNRWVRFTLTLQTAGPVVISTRADVVPVLSGKGMSLVTGQPISFVLPRGARLYYGCASVQRVSVLFEPIPWANEIAGKVDQVTQAIGSAAGAIVSTLRSLTRRP